MKWNYLDLFSGIGGFRYGLELAGFEWGWTGHSEIDKYANKVYHKHYPDSEDLGDVRKISISTQKLWREVGKKEALSGQCDSSTPFNTMERQYPTDTGNTPDSTLTITIQCSTGTYTFSGRINLITFGFPCQDLSIAGKRGGLSANRSGLFFEAMRIVRDAKPDYFVFENVKGLFSSNGGFDWLNVLREVADSGYDGQWQLLNTRWFLPQNRERVYFVGYPAETGGRQIFPIGEDNKRIAERTKRPTVNTLSAGGHSGGMHSSMTLLQIGTIGKDSEATRVYSPEGCARTLKDGGGMGAKTGLYEIIEDFYPDRIRTYEDCPTLRGDRQGLKVAPLRWSRTEKGKEARRESKKSGKDYTPFNEGHRELIEAEERIAGCVTNALNKDTLIGVERRIRRLTPIEVARLQGFPDDWAIYDAEGNKISDTQQYKMYGNAVTTLVVKAVGERILKP